MRALRRFRWKRLLFATVITYGFVCAALVIAEPHFLYMPFNGPNTPEAAGLPSYSLQHTTATDGTPINYWEHPSASGPILLYFHGNGGGLHAFTFPLAQFAQAGFHVIAMEYRGYPGAAGKPSQQALTADAIALFDQTHQRYPNRPIAIWGYSLGTGIAVQLAAERAPAALVLEAPFSATVDLAATIYPFIPVRHLMRDQYRSREAITRVHAPLFIMHGETDRLVPITSGETLYNAANDPKEFHRYAGIGHLDLMHSPAYADAFAFLTRMSGL